MEDLTMQTIISQDENMLVIIHLKNSETVKRVQASVTTEEKPFNLGEDKPEDSVIHIPMNEVRSVLPKDVEHINEG